MPTVPRKVDACHLIDVSLETFPTLSFAFGYAAARAQVCRVSHLFLLLAAFFSQTCELFLQSLRFSVYFRHPSHIEAQSEMDYSFEKKPAEVMGSPI